MHRRIQRAGRVLQRWYIHTGNCFIETTACFVERLLLCSKPESIYIHTAAMSQVVREGDLRVWLVHISPLLGIDGRQLLKLLYYGKPLTWNKLGDSVSTPVDIYSQIAPNSSASGADAGARPQLISNEQFLSTIMIFLF